jgi:Carboxypeptidase regulatory-like domain/TonB dependent receptor
VMVSARMSLPPPASQASRPTSVVRNVCRICLLQTIALQVLGINLSAAAQTSSTGALIGVVVDPSGKTLPGATVEIRGQDISVVRSDVCDTKGVFTFPLLPAGLYVVTAHEDGFVLPHTIVASVPVTESIRLAIRMTVEGGTQNVEVRSETSPLQIDTPALGRMVDGQTIQSLPLVTRNFTQITNLSPGVLSGVNNAGELGAGSGGLAQIDPSNDGTFVHGLRSYDNSYEFDGVPVTDIQASSIASGGVPIPNPDAIQEFKVQTGLYDASFGERAGANVSLVTKAGTKAFHGSVFEFLRNDALNANDFFFNRTDKPRPPLKQNQFGLTVGGPIRHDRVYYFGSYQGTRQTNGLASGQARLSCSASIVLPPLTDDRSPQALGALFAGMAGAFGGTSVKSDGSNINPVALKLMQFKLSNGAFLIPSPQTITTSLPLASQGLSTLSVPCRFDGDQVLANLDASVSQNSRLSIHWMWSNGQMNVSFPGNGLNGTGNISGSPSNIDNDFRVLSLSYTQFIKGQWLNEIRFGYTQTLGSTSAQAPFQWSDLGVSAGMMNNENGLPSLAIPGSINLTSAFPRTFDQHRFLVSDTLTFSNGHHLVEAGGSLSRIQDDLNIVGLGSLVEFLSWPDFLLGLDATQNGTGLFSNIYASIDDYGLLDRRYRSWNGSLYAGDHYRPTSTLSIDAGLRYEKLGQFGDDLGRNSSFDVARANPNPSPAGSVDGYIVAKNYQGMLPPGVIRAANDAANSGDGQNSLAPRVGLAWQPSGQGGNFVLRAGYGVFLSQPTGQAFFTSVFGAPFSLARLNVGSSNATATLAHPFPEPFPSPDFFPYFPAYSPASNVTISTVSPGFRPSIVQQFGLNWQAEFARDWVLEAGYVGTRGTHLLRNRSLNQALSASVESPIRGATTNTVDNIDLRVPVQGVPPDALQLTESAGTSWYNGLEASLSKRLSKGLQGLCSYTFSKILDSDGSNINGISAGNTLTLGDQNSPRQRWGRASFNRTHRLVISAVYAFPSPQQHLARILLSDWLASGVFVWQTGAALTIAYTNSTNIFGISEDRAQLTPGCNKSNLLSHSTIERRLDAYFNSACLTTPPIVGADGIGTAFGNSSTGIVDGPGQSNLDLAIMRTASLHWPNESTQLQFRAEFFNVLNHPQFSNPNTTYGSSAFGIISSSSVNPRVGQLAVKVIF